MLYVIQVILLALALANALPALPDQEISENAIDNNSDDFSKELPFEAEYYRTSTDRDDFVRPIVSPDDNEIDNGDGGIDLDDPSTWNQTPDCTYHIDIRVFKENIDQLSINIEGLTLKNDSSSNQTLKEFVRQAQVQIFKNIKGQNLTNELVNDVINYLRLTFVSVYGYEDYCGVSTNVVTYFTKNDTQVDSPEVNEETTDAPVDKDVQPMDTQPEDKEIKKGAENRQPEAEVTEPVIKDSETVSKESQPEITESTQSETETSDTETTTNSEESTTEEYQSRVLIRPKLGEIVQETINFYKALRNFKYSQQS